LQIKELIKEKVDEDEENGYVQVSKYQKNSEEKQKTNQEEKKEQQKEKNTQSQSIRTITSNAQGDKPDNKMKASQSIIMQQRNHTSSQPALELKKKDPIELKMEIEHIEHHINTGYSVYNKTLGISLFYSTGSFIGTMISSLHEPFDLTLIPVSLWMGFLCIVILLMFDAKKKRSPTNQKLSLKCIIYCLIGNILVVVYFIAQLVGIYPQAGEAVTNFVLILIYLLFFVFFDIIFLLAALPDAKKAYALFEQRSNLLLELYSNVYSI